MVKATLTLHGFEKLPPLEKRRVIRWLKESARFLEKKKEQLAGRCIFRIR